MIGLLVTETVWGWCVVGTFGEKLRREREMRAVTLEEIAEATKIGTRSLKALEDEHFEILPGGIFNKGFVRAYAKYLGIDQEQAVNDYLVAAGEAQPEWANSKEIEQIASQADVARQRKEALLAASGQQTGGKWIVWAALVLLLASGAGGWKYYEQWKARRIETATLESKRVQPPPVPVAATPVAEKIPDANTILIPSDAKDTTGTITPSATAPDSAVPDKPAQGNADASAPAAEFKVQVHAAERLWVSVTSDGHVVQKGMLSADEVRTFAAKSKLVLVSGKPGAVDIQWNGQKQTLPTVSTSSQILTFTADGMQR